MALMFVFGCSLSTANGSVRINYIIKKVFEITTSDQSPLAQNFVFNAEALIISTNMPPPSFSPMDLIEMGYSVNVPLYGGAKIPAIPATITAFSDNSKSVVVNVLFHF